MKKTVAILLFPLVGLLGCGGGESSTGSSSASGSSAPKSGGQAANSSKPSTPSKPAKKAPELKEVEDTKVGYKVQVPKDGEEKKQSDTFHTYSLGMPVDYTVAVQVMGDADPTFKNIDEFIAHEKPRSGDKDPISKKELGKDRYLIVFAGEHLHGPNVEANLWMMVGKKKFWVRCGALKEFEQLATDMCTSFTPL